MEAAAREQVRAPISAQVEAEIRAAVLEELAQSGAAGQTETQTLSPDGVAPYAV